MNFNALIAVLVLKGILTKDEGEKLVEHINNKPQSTQLADTIEQIEEFITKRVPKLAAAVKAEAKKVAGEVADKVAHEVSEIDDAVNKRTDNKAKK